MSIFDFFNKTNYSFEGKKDSEKVILFLHKHWYTISNKVFGVFIAALIPFAVIIIGGQYLQAYGLIPVFAFLWILYYLFLWFFLFYIFTIYNLNNWIVTDQRIVDRAQNGLFDQTVSELNVVNIQDVSFSMEGAIATMMNYGCIEVQTAGHDDKFVFKQIPNPQRVKDEIMQIADAAKNGNGVNTVRNGDSDTSNTPINK